MGNEFDRHFRRWLRAGMTGCSYAATLASEGGRLAVETHLAVPTADDLDDSLDVYRRVAFVLDSAIAAHLAFEG